MWASFPPRTAARRILRRATPLTTTGEGKKMIGISTELLTNPKQADGQGRLLGRVQSQWRSGARWVAEKPVGRSVKKRSLIGAKGDVTSADWSGD